MKVSIRDLANSAQISACTVSKALRDEPGVADATRKKVKEIADRLGYVPNIYAHSLRKGQKSILTVIYSIYKYDTINRRNFILYKMAQDKFDDIRLQIRNSNETLDEAVNKAIYENSKSIILHQQVGTLDEKTVRLIKKHEIAVTCLDCKGLDIFDNVFIDREIGTFQAMRLLLLSECKNIIIYSRGTLNNPDGRVRGIIKACQSLGKGYNSFKLYPIPENADDYMDGYMIAKHLIKSEKFDGIFGFNDIFSIGTMSALQEVGIHIPEQVKIIGFDNIAVGEYLSVKLTSVELPMENICEVALDINRKRMTKFNTPIQGKSVSTKLIIRDSCPIHSHSLREKVFIEA